MLDTNGNEKYSLDLDLGHTFKNDLLQYKQLDTEDVVVFTSGDLQVQFARVITSVSNPFVPAYNTLYDNTAVLDRRLRGLFIKSRD